jgi:hypothetical protein
MHVKQEKDKRDKKNKLKLILIQVLLEKTVLMEILNKKSFE